MDISNLVGGATNFISSDEVNSYAVVYESESGYTITKLEQVLEAKTVLSKRIEDLLEQIRDLERELRDLDDSIAEERESHEEALKEVTEKAKALESGHEAFTKKEKELNDRIKILVEDVHVRNNRINELERILSNLGWNGVEE